MANQYIQGKAWQMGVAVPIKNSRFSLGTRVSGNVSEAITTNDDKLVLSTESLYYSDDVFQFMDSIRVIREADKLSETFDILTASTNKGSTPTTSDFYIRHPSNTLTYSIDDHYVGIGNGKAGGWNLPQTTAYCEGIKKGVISRGYKGLKTLTGSVTAASTVSGVHYATVELTLSSGEYLLGLYHNGSFSCQNTSNSQHGTFFNLVDMRTGSGKGQVRVTTPSLWSVGNGVQAGGVTGAVHLGGLFGPYAQRFCIPFSGGGTLAALHQPLLRSGGDSALKGTLTDVWRYDTLVANAYYRVGLIIRMQYENASGVNQGSTYFKVQVNTGNPITADSFENIASATDTGWMHFISDPVMIRSWGSKTSVPEIQLIGNATGTSGNLIVYLDRVTLEHGGGLLYPQDGCLDFSRYNAWPTMQTIQKGYIRPAENQADLADGSISDVDPTGRKSDSRITIKCRFDNVSQSFKDDIDKLLEWQSHGHALVLHPFINDLPSSIMGKMSISGETKPWWDLNLCSFDFTFIEA